MLYRPHRGSYEDAISEVVNIPETKEDLLQAIKDAYKPWEILFTVEDLIIDDCARYDGRKGWSDFCYIVSVDKPMKGVLGYISKKI